MMNKMVKCIIENSGKVFIAVVLLFLGGYWFHYSFSEWQVNNYAIFGSGGKGKGPIVGVFFSSIILVYGFYIIYNLKKCNKT
jgi:hypothetical protein